MKVTFDNLEPCPTCGRNSVTVMSACDVSAWYCQSRGCDYEGCSETN